MAPNEFPDGNGTKIAVVFTRFIQEINGERYPFKAMEKVVLEVVYVE